MTTHATGHFDVKSWENEKPVSEIAGQPALIQVDVTYAYQGDLEGEGQVRYQMYASGNKVTYFSGYEQFTGRLGEREGSFVFHHRGTYEGATNLLTIDFSIVTGSATGDLSGLSGQGNAIARHEQPPATFTLEYEFA